MAAKEKHEKFGRAFKLAERQASELSLNTSPEKAGTERVKCADLSVKFTMRGAEIAKLDKGLAGLWNDDKTPAIENLKMPIQLGCTFKGTATIGSVRAVGDEYDARMTDFKVQPALAGELEVRARIRVYVEHETDALYDLVIAGLCKIQFGGKLVLAAKSTEHDEDDVQLEFPGAAA